MRSVLILVAFVTATVVSAGPGDLLRCVHWQVEAVYSRTDREIPKDIPEDAQALFRSAIYSFKVVQTKDSAYPKIRSIDVDSMGWDTERFKQQARRFEALAPGAHILITVTCLPEKFTQAEASETGQLRVDPESLETNEPKKPANQTLQHNDPSCHESCLRTPRASRGRG